MINISRRMAELATAIVLLVAVAALFAQTFTFAEPPIKGYPGAAFFPQLALGMTAIFLVVWIVALIRRRSPSSLAFEQEDATIRFECADYLVTLGLSLGFVIGLGLVGFEISCFLFLVVILFLRLRKLLVALAAAAVTTMVLYAVFVLLLNVSLPLLFLPRFVSF